MTRSNFSVISWNVNSVKARLNHVLKLLKELQPDALCLQELKCTTESFPLTEIKTLGYEAAIYGQKTYNGVALLARHPIQNVVYGFDGVSSETSARLILATINNHLIYSAYIPNGQEVGSDKYKEKLLFFKSLLKCLNERHRKDDSILLAGDFNVAPQDQDVHDPDLWRGRILFSDRERKELATLSQWGLIDTYRHQHPSQKAFTWWDYRASSLEKNLGLRIDHIYCTEVLAKRLIGSGVHREYRSLEKPSDHAPVYAHFLFP